MFGAGVLETDVIEVGVLEDDVFEVDAVLFTYI